MIRNSFLRTLTRASLVVLFPFSAADKIVHWNQAMKQAEFWASAVCWGLQRNADGGDRR